MHAQERPVYRHLVVSRKGFVEKVATKEQFKRLRQFLVSNLPIPNDLVHLVRDSFSKEQIEDTFGFDEIEWSTAPDAVDVSCLADEMSTRRLSGDASPIKVRPPTAHGAVVVGRLSQVHVPGGTERLPTNPTSLGHPGVLEADNPTEEFLRCAQELKLQFQDFSDRRFVLADPWMQKNCTLVTVVYTPILAAPRAARGFELFCEFFQVTRFGSVDASKDGFEVLSETGEFPIQPPGDIEMATMMRTVEELQPSQESREGQ